MINLVHVPEIDKWAKNSWIWSAKRFETLKDAKAYINDAYGAKLRTMIEKYDGYAYIAHYDRNANITSIVEIVPDKTSYHRYHYAKPQRLVFDENIHRLVYANEVLKR